jgi:hypothetical protein
MDGRAAGGVDDRQLALLAVLETAIPSSPVRGQRAVSEKVLR